MATKRVDRTGLARNSITWEPVEKNQLVSHSTISRWSHKEVGDHGEGSSKGVQGKLLIYPADMPEGGGRKTFKWKERDLDAERRFRNYRQRVRCEKGKESRKRGEELVERVFAHVCETWGDPGLIQDVNEETATTIGVVHSMGIRVDLPFDQEVNSFVNQAFEHRTFFTRL